MTAILDSLTRGGLVRRTANRRDGRMRLASITRKGSGRVREILPLLHKAEVRWTAALPRS